MVNFHLDRFIARDIAHREPIIGPLPLASSLFGIHDVAHLGHRELPERPDMGVIRGQHDTAVLIPGTNPRNGMFFQDATFESLFGEECR